MYRPLKQPSIMVDPQTVVETLAFAFVVVTIPLYLLQLCVIWTCFGAKKRDINQPFFKLVFVTGVCDVGKSRSLTELPSCTAGG